MEQDHHAAYEYPRSAQSSDGAANDECIGARSGTADGRSNLKYRYAGKVHRLDRVEFVDFAHEQLKAAYGEQIRASVPANVVDGVEFVCDFRDGLRYDVGILELELVTARCYRKELEKTHQGHQEDS